MNVLSGKPRDLLVEIEVDYSVYLYPLAVSATAALGVNQRWPAISDRWWTFEGGEMFAPLACAMVPMP